jgi:hypothetical protein
VDSDLSIIVADFSQIGTGFPDLQGNEMSDILKSLANFLHRDGQVVNVSSETPAEKQVAFDKASVGLSKFE